MNLETIHVTDRQSRISHNLRWDIGNQIEWVSADGTIRTPVEKENTYTYPGTFTVAGKEFSDWRSLCIRLDSSSYICQDIYGREVFYISELFPCFDSYDYANETRHYRWFFIKDNNKLTRVYYADGCESIQVTEDVQNLEDCCRNQMDEWNWLD